MKSCRILDSKEIQKHLELRLANLFNFSTRPYFEAYILVSSEQLNSIVSARNWVPPLTMYLINGGPSRLGDRASYRVFGLNVSSQDWVAACGEWP